MNQQITAQNVRLIAADGEQAGVVSIAAALEQARVAGLDLVEIAPNANPPVAKILDWGKYRYEQTKQDQKNRKHQRNHETKQVRLGLKIGDHDLEVKAKHARSFLEFGHKVKVGLRFRGREITHPDLGRAVLEKFVQLMSEGTIREQEPTMSGREMTILLAPAKSKQRNEDAETENSPRDGQAD